MTLTQRKRANFFPHAVKRIRKHLRRQLGRYRTLARAIMAGEKLEQRTYTITEVELRPSAVQDPGKLN